MPRMPPPMTRRSYVALESCSRASARLGLEPEAGCVPRAGTDCRVDWLVIAGSYPSSVLVFDPAHGPLDGLEPALVLTVADVRVHVGGPFRGPAPVGAQVLGVGPEADGQTGGVGGAEAGGLGDHRAHHGGVQDVGQG